jgi:gas vesicle protein
MTPEDGFCHATHLKGLSDEWLQGAQKVNAQRHTRHDYRFRFGFLTGTLIGSGLAIWFAPRLASELRERVIASATDVGTRAADRYKQVRNSGAEVVGALARQAQDARDDLAGAVARGGHEVERLAIAAKSDRVSEARKSAEVTRAAVETA